MYKLYYPNHFSSLNYYFFKLLHLNFFSYSYSQHYLSVSHVLFLIIMFQANKVIPTEVQKEALDLQQKLEFDDAGGEGVTSHIDDEYKWIGVEDPKIVVTTSRDPSSKLKEFAKVCLILRYCFLLYFLHFLAVTL